MQCRVGRYFSNLRLTTHTFDHCASQAGQWRTTDLSEELSRSWTLRAIWTRSLCRDQTMQEFHFQLWWRQLYSSYAWPTWICGLHVRETMMDRRGNGGVGWRCRLQSWKWTSCIRLVPAKAFNGPKGLTCWPFLWQICCASLTHLWRAMVERTRCRTKIWKLST